MGLEKAFHRVQKLKVERFKKPSIEEIETWLGKKFFKRECVEIILYLSILCYAVAFSTITILRYHAFKAGAWDLGIFTQSLWTTLNANRFFYHTCEIFLNPSGSFFGVHFSPILFLILPLYWFFQTPETLLVFQSFIIALAAFPLYKLAKENAGGRTVGIIFVFAYFLYPATHFVNWYDFHVQAFLPLFFFYAIYYVAKEKWLKYFSFAFLSLMCEEHVAIITFFVGVYIAWMHKSTIVSALKSGNPTEKKLAVPLATMAISVVWYWLSIWQRNTFFPINPECMDEFLGSANFTILGARDPAEVPLMIILRPWNAIQALVYDGHLKLLYIALLFGPLAFFSFKKLSTLIPTIPWFVFSFISQSPAHHVIGNHYEAYVTPFIFAAAIFALRKKILKTPNMKSVEGSLKKIMAFSLIFFIAASPLCPVVSLLFPNYTSIHRGEHEILLSEILSMVPSNASILTQNNLFPQVSHRVNAYVVPKPFLDTGCRDLIIEFLNQTIDDVDFILVDIKSDPQSSRIIFYLMQDSHKHEIIASADGIFLFKKEYAGKATMLAPYVLVYRWHDFNLYSGEIVEDSTSKSKRVLYFNGSRGPSQLFWYSPRTLLPPGNYLITLGLQVNGTYNKIDEIFTVEVCSNEGRSVLRSKTFFGRNFASSNGWVNQTLYLTLDKPLLDFEVRTVDVSSQANIYFDYIEVRDISH